MEAGGVAYEVRIRRCEGLAALNRWDEGLREAKAALGLDPSRHDAWFEAGRFLIMLKQPEEALRHIGEGLSRRPNYAWGHQLRSLALSNLGRHADALEAVDEALKIRPRDVGSLRRRARALWALDRREDALTSLRAGLEAAPEDVESLCLLSDWLLIGGDKPGSLQAAERAVALDPTSIFALHCLGDALEKSGRYAEALDAYARAIKTDPVKAAFAKTRLKAVIDEKMKAENRGAHGCMFFTIAALGAWVTMWLLDLLATGGALSKASACMALPLTAFFALVGVYGLIREVRAMPERKAGQHWGLYQQVSQEQAEKKAGANPSAR